MKFVFVFALLCVLGVSGNVVIDNFLNMDASGTQLPQQRSQLAPTPDSYQCDVNSGACQSSPYAAGDQRYSVLAGLSTTTTIGGVRKFFYEILATENLLGITSFAVGDPNPSKPLPQQTQNVLTFSVGDRTATAFELHYDGKGVNCGELSLFDFDTFQETDPCPPSKFEGTLGQVKFDPTGLSANRVDLTNGGSDSAIELLLAFADLDAFIFVEVYSDTNSVSVSRFNPKDFGSFATGNGISVILPFSDFAAKLGASPANFRRVTAVKLYLEKGNFPTSYGAPPGYQSFTVDLAIDLLQSTPMVFPSKEYAIVGKAAGSVALPGDIIEYTVRITNPVDAIGSTANDIVFVDNPSEIGIAPLNLIPNSVTVQNGGANVNVEERTVDGKQVVVVSELSIPDDTEAVITFQAQMPASLPCCLDRCDFPESTVQANPITNGERNSGCLFAAQEDSSVQSVEAGRCYCAFNRGYMCPGIGVDDIFAGEIDDLCLQTSSSQIILPENVDYPVAVPIFAPTDPRLTKTVEGGVTTATAGDSLRFEIVVKNEGTRQSPLMKITDNVPVNSLAVSTGSDFTCDGNVANSPCETAEFRLDAGEERTFYFAFQVNPSLSCGGGDISSTARISYVDSDTCTCQDTNLANNEDTAGVSAGGSPNLGVTKAAAPVASPLIPGGKVIYTITVTNNGGTAPAQNVVLTDTLGANLTPLANDAGSSQGWSCPGQVCTKSDVATALAPGASVQVTLVAEVNIDAACDVVEVTNTVVATDDCASVVDSIATTPVVGTFSLDIVKTLEPNVIDGSGSPLSYAITVTNNGQRLLEGVEVTETAPAHTIHDSNGWDCPNGASAECTFTIGNLAVGETEDLTFTVIPDSTFACEDRTTVNTATVTSTCPASTDQAPLSTPIQVTPDLQIVKTTKDGATSVDDNKQITFVLAYSNIGKRGATNVQITETLLANFVHVAGEDEWSCTDSTCTHSVEGEIAPGDQGSVEFTVQFTGSDASCNGDSFNNVACISNGCDVEELQTDLENNCDDADFTVSGTPDLFIVKTVSSNVRNAGDSLVITIVIGNQGTAPSVPTIVADIPEHTTVSTSNPSQWDCTAVTSCKVSLASLAPGAEDQIDLVVVVDDPLACDEISTDCRVVVDGDCDEPNLENNVGTDSIDLVAQAAFAIEKEDGDAFFKQDGDVEYTITFWNIGNRDATNVRLDDIVPPSTFYSGNNGWLCAAGTCTMNIGSLPAVGPTARAAGQFIKETRTIQFTLQASVGANIDETENIVYVRSDEGICGGEEVANELTPIVGNPDMYVRKSDNGVIASPGDIVQYYITYGNAGDRLATGVVVTETIPAFAQFAPEHSDDGWSCESPAVAGAKCTFTHPNELSQVNPGQSRNIVFAVKLSEWIRCGVESVVNKVSVADDGNNGEDSVPSNNFDDEETPVIGEPDLKIFTTDNLNDMAREDRVSVGEEVCYDIWWVNAGVRDATNVIVTARLPQYTSYSGNNVDSWVDDGEGNYFLRYDELLPDVVHDGKGSAQFCVVVDSFPPGVKGTEFWVSITNDCGESNPLDNDAHEYTPFVTIIDVAIEEVGRCNIIEWNIEYSNIGDQDASGVKLVEQIPTGTVFSSDLSQHAWNCEATGEAGDTCSLDIGDLTAGAGGATVFVTTPTQDSTETVYHNCVAINRFDAEGDEIADPTPDNNVGCTEIGLEGCPDLCDSCCPEPTECCPDNTEVIFSFGGILEGIGQCSA